MAAQRILQFCRTPQHTVIRPQNTVARPRVYIQHNASRIRPSCPHRTDQRILCRHVFSRRHQAHQSRSILCCADIEVAQPALSRLLIVSIHLMLRHPVPHCRGDPLRRLTLNQAVLHFNYLMAPRTVKPDLMRRRHRILHLIPIMEHGRTRENGKFWRRLAAQALQRVPNFLPLGGKFFLIVHMPECTAAALPKVRACRFRTVR